ncbi:hypothetical protein DFJ58DRAFT_842284 [Suillus subalutaceus]|uniref:uncharacterized protein n=1 Tax=Suillus subalutaceus TaxID=48586 RepID=UPI001B86B066|nr:uncharacterized protein DFJ58DRAFT_842284 [Suillus subalutaceus]KAG1851090.1 hypothetical protein DFJ58DRAFT_842284 [Suillus subalutaceus]
MTRLHHYQLTLDRVDNSAHYLRSPCPSAIMGYFCQTTKKTNWYQLETQPTTQNPMLMNGAGPIPMSHCHQSSNLGIPLRLLATMQLSSEQHHPVSASVHHEDEDQPPCPKPKPKPKPRHTTCDEHEDSESRLATTPVPPRTSSPLSDLTDNDNNFTPPPLAQPSK